jgi:hypothetical protein
MPGSLFADSEEQFAVIAGFLIRRRSLEFNRKLT